MPQPSRQHIESETPAPPVPRLPVRHLLADDVYESIRAMIMDHEIAPGERVSIDGLARDLQVSQTPIREALARLESEALVSKEPLRGYSVASLLTREALEDLYELRLLLEPWAAARTAQGTTDDGLARLNAELATCPAASEGSRTNYQAYRLTLAHDGRFHDLIAELCGSAQVRAAFERTHAHLHLFRLGYGRDYDALTLEEHRAIVDAVAARSPEDAEAAMRTHLTRALARLLPMAK
jgi:DNA-binding GntR family transcriptional regulator